VASTWGSYLLGLGFLVIAAYLLHSLFRGEPAPANPWGAATLEWETTSPPPPQNFDHDMRATDPYDIESLRFDPETRGYVRKDPSSVIAHSGEAE
jgi:cytochrome c oxidase subunit 1